MLNTKYMYSYNLKYKVELPEDTLWHENVKEEFFKSSYEKGGIFDSILKTNAKSFIQAKHPLKIIHLEEIEPLDVKQELD